MDRGIVTGPRYPDHTDCRGRLRPLCFGNEGGTRGGGEEIERAKARDQGRQCQAHREHPAGLIRVQNHQLRAGIHADARRGERIPLEPELRRDRTDVARGLHYPKRIPWQDQGGV